MIRAGTVIRSDTVIRTVIRSGTIVVALRQQRHQFAVHLEPEVGAVAR
jgi:hypothetical protein